MRTLAGLTFLTGVALMVVFQIKLHAFGDIVNALAFLGYSVIAFACSLYMFHKVDSREEDE